MRTPRAKAGRRQQADHESKLPSGPLVGPSETYAQETVARILAAAFSPLFAKRPE
jgi:hypothetical protein